MSAAPTFSPNIVTKAHHTTVASAWHTIIILTILFGLSVLTARSGNLLFVDTRGRIPGYLSVMLLEWAIVAFIWHGVGRRGMRLLELVGGRWSRPANILRDLGVAVGFLVVSGLTLNGLGYLLKVAPNQAIRNLLPRSAAEIVVYLMLTATAGFCEELIFRGYFQRQFAAWTQSLGAGIVLQGIVFGAAHAYQGWKYVLVIAVFGSMFGLLAHWRHSLRPGMLAHFLQDGVGGLVGRHLLR